MWGVLLQLSLWVDLLFHTEAVHGADWWAAPHTFSAVPQVDVYR